MDTLIAYLFLSLYIILPAAAIYFFKHNLNKPGLSTYSSYVKCNLNKTEEKTDKEKLDNTKIDKIVTTIQDRAGARGTIISILLSCSAIIQAILKGMGASEPRLLLLYGFIMAAVIGYMGDQSYGTDEGFSLFKMGTKYDNIMTGVYLNLKFTLGKLVDDDFWRYVVTVFLDMFISGPLIGVILDMSNNFLKSMDKVKPNLPGKLSILLDFLIKNYDNVLQSFVGIITFQAYTNDTRFKWAYPSNVLDKSKLLNPDLIKISTVIAGLVFLLAYSAKNNLPLVDSTNSKFLYLLIVIVLISAGSFKLYKFEKETSIPTTYEKGISNLEQKYTNIQNWWKGLGVFYTYALVGIVLPFLPLIYEANEKHNASWGKLFFIFLVVSGITFGTGFFLYSYEKTKPDAINDIKKAELEEEKKSTVDCPKF